MAKPDRYSKSSAEQKQELDDLEEAIETLRMMYQRYFNGVDDIPPTKMHAEIKKAVNLLMNRSFRTAQLRFRFQGMRARMITYEQHWRRILHQIERGTFKRVVAVARMRQYKISRGRGHELEALRGSSGPIDLSGGMNGSGGGDYESLEDLLGEAAAAVDAVAQARESSVVSPAPAPPNGRPRPAPSARTPRPQLPAGMDAREARQLFKEFVAAKKAAGQSTAGITYGALVKKLARDVPRLRQKLGADRKIEFEVRSEGGKVRLRAKS